MRDPEDRSVGVIADQQSPILRDRDPRRAAPDRLFVQRETGHEDLVDAGRPRQRALPNDKIALSLSAAASRAGSTEAAG